MAPSHGAEDDDQAERDDRAEAGNFFLGIAGGAGRSRRRPARPG